MPTVRRVAFPKESRLHRDLDRAYYVDAFETDLADASLTPVEIATRAFASTPGWVGGLIALRDGIVSVFGLKTSGGVRFSDVGPVSKVPAVGDSFSIFRVFSVDGAELVLGIDDKHLDVRISFLKRLAGARANYLVNSWVNTHNLLGRTYMVPVAPIHRLLVGVMMRGAPM
jgi:Protein of unknown function (DUF2867)